MADPTFQRLQRDLEDLLLRVRSLESLQTPGQAQAIADLREVRQKVVDMDVHGTAVTQERFRGIENTISDIREDLADLKGLVRTKAEAAAVQEIKEDQKASRRIVQSALITAALAIGVNIIVGVLLYVVLK